jgi:hypothetical protein
LFITILHKTNSAKRKIAKVVIRTIGKMVDVYLEGMRCSSYVSIFGVYFFVYWLVLPFIVAVENMIILHFYHIKNNYKFFRIYYF